MTQEEVEKTIQDIDTIEITISGLYDKIRELKENRENLLLKLKQHLTKCQ